jgi:hypothetical protein
MSKINELDEAIKHAEDVAILNENTCKAKPYSKLKRYKKCGEEHRQLAEWLKELKQLREQTRWIPVSERLPEDGELILFSTKTDRVFEGRFFVDKTDLQWYVFRDKAFAYNNVVTAWLPLPKPYKESED